MALGLDGKKGRGQIAALSRRAEDRACGSGGAVLAQPVV